MKRQGIGISIVYSNEIIDTLNQLLSEKWLAYYQYMKEIRFIESPLRYEIESELYLHAKQEFNHATLIVNRIIQLGGTPLLTPLHWIQLRNYNNKIPDNPFIEELLKQDLNSERSIIKRINEIVDLTNTKDIATFQIASIILNDEIKHEQDIKNWINNLDNMKR